MSDQLFLKIIKREIPAEIVFENDNVLAFKDIMPQAPIHVLFIHKVPTRNINESMREAPQQILEIFSAIQEYTVAEGLEAPGFRIVANTNAHGGQTVFHTHFHLLAGAPLGGFGLSRSNMK